jgi:hypothetical protein
MRTLFTAILLSLPALAAPVPADKGKPIVDIRDGDDKVILAADDIVSYDWKTHTLTVKEGAKAKFVKDKNIGDKFKVAINGKAVFEGNFISPVVSSVKETPCIVTPEFNGKLGDDKIRIQAGYPTDKQATKDLRDVKDLKDALEKAGKLKAEK